MDSMTSSTARHRTGYIHGTAARAKHNNVARVVSMLIAVLMLMATMLTAAPLMLDGNADNAGNASKSGLASFLADGVMRTAAAKEKGTDAPGSSEDDYKGCPGNDGKDDSDEAKKVAQADNDSRQICYLKNKDVDADALGDANLSDDGKGKKTGDAEWNYNNLTDNKKDSKYGQDVKNDKDSSSKSAVNTSIFATFSMVLSRTIMPDYYVNSDVPASDSDDVDQAMKWQMGENACSSLDNASAYDNDNCDVPGIVTQAYQNISYLIAPSGIQGGNKLSALIPFNMGIPAGLIPAGSNGKPDVPVEGERGSNKYTALELFGYNLHWTKYNGEWDKIDVLTSDRMKANINIFGTVISSFKMAASNAVNGANQDVSDAWNKRDVLATAAAIITWPFKVVENTITGTIYFFINGVMNGYENSIIQRTAWNRNDFYRDTSYNARMAADTDQAAITEYLVKWLTQQNKNEDTGVGDGKLDELNKQAAFPGSEPKPDIKEGMSNDEKLQAYVDAFEKWKTKHKDKLDWGSQNLGTKNVDGSDGGTDVDYYIGLIKKQIGKNNDATKDDASSSDHNNGGGSTAETQTYLHEIFEQFRSNWAALSTNWVAEQSKANGSLAGAFMNALSKFSDQESIAGKANKMLGKNAIYFFCTDRNGNPSPAEYHKTKSEAYNMALNAGMKWYGDPAFNVSEDGTVKVADCANGKIRQPIVGALNGQAGTADQKQQHQDTRRTAYHGVTLMNLIGDPVDKLAEGMLSISQKIAIGINYLVNLSFTPLLDQLGIKDVVVGIVKTLKDSLYLQCLQIFIILGVMYAFVKGVFGKRHVEGIKQVLLVCVAGIMGLVLLYNPEATFKVIDEYPSMFENAVAALMLESASPNEDMCGASGTPTEAIDGSKYVDVRGNATGFNPNASIRQLECNIWDAYVFEPWSLGQFGVGHMMLYAQGHAPTDTSAAYETMDVDDATNTLVGDAGVDMGGGTTVNNWALYQISQQLGGTTTTNDSKQTLLTTDTDLYRLVDLQAGPDNAAGKATKHWVWWIGDGNRFAIGGLALINSIGGIASIGMFAVAKIEATFMMSVLFAMMPVMLLIGIIPGSGRMKMQAWGAKLIGLAFKRVVLVALLCVQLIILISIANSNTKNAVASIMFMTAMSCIFASYGKEIIKAFTEPIDRQAGAFSNIDERMRRKVMSGINNNALVIGARGVVRGIPQMAGSMVGSMMAGGFRANSAKNKFARWESRQRDEIGKARDTKVAAAQKKRQQLMDAYNNGTITGNQYIAGQAEIDKMEAEAAREYTRRIQALSGYQRKFENDFNFRSQIVNDESLNDGNAGMSQLGNTFARAKAEVDQQQRAAGNNFVAFDAYNAVKDEEAYQIQNAYDNLFVQNPQIGRALLGNPDNEKELQELLKGVDLREVNQYFNLSTAENVQLTQAEMERLGAMYSFDANGNATLDISPEAQSLFRKVTLDQFSGMGALDNPATNGIYGTAGSMGGRATGVIEAENMQKQAEKLAKQIAAENGRGQVTQADMDAAYQRIGTETAGSSTPVEKMQHAFIDGDVRKRQHDIAASAAMKYIPSSQQQLDEVKASLKQALGDNPVDNAKIDNIQDVIVNAKLDGSDSLVSAKNLIGHEQLMKDIDAKRDAAISEVQADASLSDADRKAQIKEIRQSAAAEKNKYAATSDEYVMGQAQIIADGMFAAGIDQFVENNRNLGVIGVSIGKDGRLKAEFDSSVKESDNAAYLENSDEFDNLQTLHSDILAMAAYTGKQESGFSTKRDMTGDDTLRYEEDKDGHYKGEAVRVASPKPNGRKNGKQDDAKNTAKPVVIEAESSDEAIHHIADNARFRKNERIIQGNGKASLSDEMRRAGKASRDAAMSTMSSYRNFNDLPDDQFRNDAIITEPILGKYDMEDAKPDVSTQGASLTAFMGSQSTRDARKNEKDASRSPLQRAIDEANEMRGYRTSNSHTMFSHEAMPQLKGDLTETPVAPNGRGNRLRPEATEPAGKGTHNPFRNKPLMTPGDIVPDAGNADNGGGKGHDGNHPAHDGGNHPAPKPFNRRNR